MKSLNFFEFVGVSLTVLGSFLPWESAGDPFSIVTNGVWIDIVKFKYWFRGIYEFPVYDYGGVLVILLTSVIVLLALQPPRFVKNPILLNLIISVLLMASSLFFVGRWFTHFLRDLYFIGGAAIQIGLISVMIGSALLLWKAILKYRQANK